MTRTAATKYERAALVQRSKDRPFVKICCISSIEEAELAISSGASAIGLVSSMPSGPGVISEELIAEIASATRGRVESVLLTSETEPHVVASQVRMCDVTGVQLCAWLGEEARLELRRLVPETMLMPVIHVVDATALDKAESAQRHADRILLDSGTLSGPVRELGGTGRTHDWSISRQIVASSQLPVLLAGGLKPANVRNALREVNPFGLDVCSGVRRDGSLDKTRLKAFLSAASTQDG